MARMLIVNSVAIAQRDTQLNVAQVLAQLGGGKMAITLPADPNIPSTVDARMSKCSTPLVYNLCF